MKKIILFVFILVIIPVILIPNYSKSSVFKEFYPNFRKDKKWEYVKERIFNGKDENIYNYSGPILVELSNASKLDSLAIENNFDELRTIIPAKDIDYFRSFTGSAPLANPDRRIQGYKHSDLSNITIFINITEVEALHEAYSLNNKRFLNTVKPKGKYIIKINFNSRLDRPSGFSDTSANFNFHKSQTVQERQDIIRFYLVRLISCANLFKERNETYFDVPGAILNNQEASINDTNFTAYDTFLLQKLYSPTLMEDYKDYMYKAYSWRIASNFINKEKTELISNWVRSVLLVILFFLAFSILYKRQYKFPFLSYFLPIATGLVCILHTSMVQMFIAIPTLSGYSYLYSLLYYLILALITSFSLLIFDKFIIKTTMSFMQQIIFKMCFTFLIFTLPILVDSYFGYIDDWFLQFNYYIAIALFFSIGRGILIYLDYFSENLIKQKDIELSHLKSLKSEAEFKLLQSQINPHFLYNSLNSIASLALVDAKKTQKMAYSLSHLFKYSINRNNKKMSTLNDEVTMVKRYLEIEQIRFGDRLSFKINVDDALLNAEIPQFIIQPLVENAVKHGVSQIENPGVITLNIKNTSKGIMIEVKDNGPDFPDNLVSGHGLQTVYDLLNLTYGNKASLNWENTPEKVIIILIS